MKTSCEALQTLDTHILTHTSVAETVRNISFEADFEADCEMFHVCLLHITHLDDLDESFQHGNQGVKEVIPLPRKDLCA